MQYTLYPSTQCVIYLLMMASLIFLDVVTYMYLQCMHLSLHNISYSTGFIYNERFLKFEVL